MKKWLSKLKKKNTSCKVLGHEWKRTSLRYHTCIYCGVKKKVVFIRKPNKG